MFVVNVYLDSSKLAQHESSARNSEVQGDIRGALGKTRAKDLGLVSWIWEELLALRRLRRRKQRLGTVLYR